MFDNAKADVSGGEFSCTTSRTLGLLGPLPGDRKPARSISSSSSSSAMPSKLVADFGVAWLTIMLGVGGGSRSLVSGALNDLVVVGTLRGGERRRFGFTPAGAFVVFDSRCASLGNSAVAGDCRRGIPVAERARCIAAADGVSGILMVDMLDAR